MFRLRIFGENFGHNAIARIPGDGDIVGTEDSRRLIAGDIELGLALLVNDIALGFDLLTVEIPDQILGVELSGLAIVNPPNAFRKIGNVGDQIDPGAIGGNGYLIVVLN
jgi:hypothetical protein